MENVYHEGKANVVADALSQKSVHALSTALASLRLRDEVRNMGIAGIHKGDSLGDLTLGVDLYEEIKEKQAGDAKLSGWRQRIEEGVESRFQIHDDGSLRFDNRWCIPDDDDLKRRILEEANSTPYSVHPGGDKLYKDLRKTFWWPGVLFVKRSRLNINDLKGNYIPWRYQSGNGIPFPWIL
ncbi:hypothetical protein vseg_017761 [Gypsophila vaccaria]